MKENISKYQNFIKDKVFESCKKITMLNYYFVNCSLAKDYETFMHDDDLGYLNFNDYD